MLNAAIAQTPECPPPLVAELYRELAPALVSFCHRILKSESSANDATHEAFARVLAHQPSLASKADFSRYMYRVALNVCLNELRRNRTVSQEDLPMWEPEVGNGEAGEVDRLFVHRILSRCDERVRTAAVLCFVEEHGCDETAAMLGCSRRSLYNWLRRFKAIAHRILKDPPRPKRASALHRA